MSMTYKELCIKYSQALITIEHLTADEQTKELYDCVAAIVDVLSDVEIETALAVRLGVDLYG